MAQRLVLIRHSQSAQDPTSPVHRWGLTDEGRRRCETLAQHLAPFSPAIVASSPESKAFDTAALTMTGLGRDAHDIVIVADLREHARETLPWLSQNDFDEKLKEFFARPDQLVIGEETASQALLRFTRAVTRIIQREPEGDIFVFTHATVLSLFVAACTGQDAFAFWRTLGMPSFVVLTLPELTLERVEAVIDAQG